MFYKFSSKLLFKQFMLLKENLKEYSKGFNNKNYGMHFGIREVNLNDTYENNTFYCTSPFRSQYS